MCLKPKVKIMNWFVKLITFNWPIGITLAPWGIYLKAYLFVYYVGTIIIKTIINHEKIHWQQQMEMLIIFFYIWYVIEWLIKLLFTFSFSRAYLSISFEQESNKYQYNYNYLDSRKSFTWMKYIFKLK